MMYLYTSDISSMLLMADDLNDVRYAVSDINTINTI